MTISATPAAVNRAAGDTPRRVRLRHAAAWRSCGRRGGGARQPLYLAAPLVTQSGGRLIPAVVLR